MWEYGEYGECSRSCDGGIKKRFPIIRQPARNRGEECPTFVLNREPQEMPCNRQSCPSEQSLLIK